MQTGSERPLRKGPAPLQVALPQGRKSIQITKEDKT